MLKFQFLLLIISYKCIAQASTQKEAYCIIQNSTTLCLSTPPPEGDAGSFTQFNILSDSPASFTANDAWDVIPTEFLSSNQNAADSKYIFSKPEKDYNVLLLWGYAYPSGRDEVTFVSFTPKGATLLHSGNLEEPLKFEDLDGDGHTELICRNEPEMISTNTSTYSPYIVYSYTQSYFGINKALSEAYNKKHYVWAGLKYREDIRVKEPAMKGGRFSIVK